MRRFQFLTGVVFAIVVGPAFAADPVQEDAAVTAALAKLPADVAAAVTRWGHWDRKELKAATAFSAEELEREVMVLLAGEPEAAGFVLERLEKEPARTQIQMLRVIGFDAFWETVPGVADRLKARAAQVSDPELLGVYLDAVRMLEMKEIRATLAPKIAAARAAHDDKALASLSAADERWLMLEHASPIPGFMRRPPAVFAVEPADRAIRVIGMGDFGEGDQAQMAVAAAIVRMGKATPFDFGITFGDNFYPSGMKGTDDPRWRDWWEVPYGPLGVTFYPSLGNHEYYSDDGAVAELSYHSATWKFPAPYYTYTAGPVQFFALDTTDMSEAQLLWLDRAITASTARWKVVYGHHPIYAPEATAKAGAYMKTTQSRLLPLLRGRVDAYLCGHHHAMAHMKTVDGVHFFMSGGGGASLGKVSKNDPNAVFAASRFGFLTLEADATKLSIALFDTDGKTFDSEVITK
jgi:tartrate-resistant acid phosphatase type 5